MLVVNGDRHLVKEIYYIIVSGHVEEAFYIIKSLEFHEMILRDQ